MQAKILVIVATALLAGSAEAGNMFRRRCCCYGNKIRDTNIGCIYSGWTGPKCPAGEYECVA